MFETIKFFFELRRHHNFRAWMKSAYTREILQRLTTEAAPRDQFTDSFVGPGIPFEDRVRMIYKRFGNDIWSYCLEEGGHYEESGPFGIECLSSLPLSFQVHDPKSFLEFMVRNALKLAAQRILDED
jgi:hypothetical protein